MRPDMKMVVLAAGLGTRLRSETGGRSKLLVKVGGLTVLDRLLDLADAVGLEPLVITRREYADDLVATGVELLVEERPVDHVTTLRQARGRVAGDFVWVGGDLLFTDPEPVRLLLAEHLARRSFASFFSCQTSRFKAKLAPGTPPRVTITHDGEHAFSSPGLVVSSPAAFDYMEADPPRDFVQRGIDAGERVVVLPYPAPVFEIDTPADLAEARRYYAADEPAVRSMTR